MTTDDLKAIWERMEKLNPKNRDMIAKKILEEIEAMEWDERWDETLASPESRAFSAKPVLSRFCTQYGVFRVRRPIIRAQPLACIRVVVSKMRTVHCKFRGGRA